MHSCSQQGNALMPRKSEKQQEINDLVAIKEFFDQMSERLDVLQEHELGRHVDRVCPKKKSTYGQNRIPEVAKVLGRPIRSCENRLWSARDLFHAYSKRDIRRLLDAAKTSRRLSRLTLNHFYIFLSVKDPDQRAMIEQQCIEHGWGVKRLRQEATKIRGRKSSGRKPFASVGSVEDALLQLTTESNDWLGRYREVWFGGDQPVFGKPLSKRQATKLLSQLQDAEGKLRELGAATAATRRWFKQQIDQAAEKESGKKSTAVKRGKKPKKK